MYLPYFGCMPEGALHCPIVIIPTPVLMVKSIGSKIHEKKKALRPHVLSFIHLRLRYTTATQVNRPVHITVNYHVQPDNRKQY